LLNQGKQKEIEKLLVQGALTWNQICKKLHVSPNSISEVKERMEQSRSPKEKSDRASALEMFDQAQSPFQVATALDIPTEDVERYQLEYWKLKGMNEIEEVYKENPGSVSPLINLHYELNSRGITVTQVFQALRKLKSVSDLKAKEIAITEDVRFAQHQLDILRHQQLVAEHHLKNLQDANMVVQQVNVNLVGLNKSLNEENQRRRTALHEFISSNGYNMMRQVAHSEIARVLKFNPLLIPAAAASVVKALTAYPHLQSLLSNPYAAEELFRAGSNPNLPPTESQLLEESQNFYYQIVSFLTRKVESDAIDKLGRNQKVPVYR
jgi:hypothetical protein